MIAVKNYNPLARFITEQAFLGGRCTMLQKLSRCEVNAARCGICMICLPFTFYLKSNFDEFNRSKDIIFANFIGSEF